MSSESPNPEWLDTLRHYDCDEPPETASMPPATWYTSAELYALEHRALLRPQWTPAGPTHTLLEPGQYRSGVTHGVPFVVIRGEDGMLRAFINVCRHKAATVARSDAMVACPTTRQLTCPYHGWRYGLQGQLLAAPRMDGRAHFDPSTHGLVPMGVCTWGPGIWVHPDVHAAPPSERFPEVDAVFAQTQWDTLQFRERRVFSLKCNWKVAVDNYLDGGYHVPYVHPGLAGQLDLKGYETTTFARSALQTSPGRPGDARVGEAAHYAWLYPHVMLNRYGSVLDINWLVPTGPRTTDFVYDFYFETPQSSFAEQSVKTSAEVQAEDTDICEDVQRGLDSEHYRPGPYAPRLEHAERLFHRLAISDVLLGGPTDP